MMFCGVYDTYSQAYKRSLAVKNLLRLFSINSLTCEDNLEKRISLDIYIHHKKDAVF